MNQTSYTYLDETARAVISGSDDARIHHILTSHYITYGRIGRLFKELQFELIKPPSTRPWGIAVKAESHQGKTMFAKHVMKSFPPAPATSQHPSTRPIVMISMTDAREARTIYTRLLEALDIEPPGPRGLKVAEREHLIKQLLRDAGTILLIVDEISDVLQVTTRQRELALHAIKYIMNSLTLPVLALGTTMAMEAFREDPHMAARFRSVELPKWKANRELAELLKGFESWLPLREPSRLHDPKLMRLLVELSDGVLGKVARTISYAAVFAVLDGTERITPEHLKRGASDIPVEALELSPDNADRKQETRSSYE